MKGHIPVEIPTKRYIKAYIISQLGEKPVIRKDHIIGSKLYDVLYHKTNERKKEFSSLYNDSIRIYINIHLFKQRGAYLNETNLKNFNRFIEIIIKERFYFLMDFYMQVWPSFEDNLPLVRKHLGIDDDYWLNDSMKKLYYRHRKQTGKPLLYNKSFTRNGQSSLFEFLPNRFAK